MNSDLVIWVPGSISRTSVPFSVFHRVRKASARSPDSSPPTNKIGFSCLTWKHSCWRSKETVLRVVYEIICKGVLYYIFTLKFWKLCVLVSHALGLSFGNIQNYHNVVFGPLHFKSLIYKIYDKLLSMSWVFGNQNLPYQTRTQSNITLA
jgi:hypothetical protein